MSERTCTVPGCEKPPRSGSADWCKMHYHRWYRHGSVDRCAIGSGITVSHGRRYRNHHRPGHPLAGPSGRVYEHRVVLYEAIGAGSHPCHWCATTVRWEAGKGEPDHLTVDHLNGVGDDNKLTNLVPSCLSCNTGRAMQARADALVAHGWWSSHDTIVQLKTTSRRPKVECVTHSDVTVG